MRGCHSLLIGGGQCGVCVDGPVDVVSVLNKKNQHNNVCCHCPEQLLFQHFI